MTPDPIEVEIVLDLTKFREAMDNMTASLGAIMKVCEETGTVFNDLMAVMGEQGLLAAEEGVD